MTGGPGSDDGSPAIELPWDESARPHGPQPGSDAAYIPRQLATGQHLVAVHDHLRSELSRLRYLVDQVVNGEVDAWDARQELIAMTLRQGADVMGAYCQAYCRLVTMHHRIEDASVFPHLRRNDPRLAAVIERLQFEHRVIHDIILSVDQALKQYAGDQGDAGKLAETVEALATSLVSHLAYEEAELVEPLARLGFY